MLGCVCLVCLSVFMLLAVLKPLAILKQPSYKRYKTIEKVFKLGMGR